MHKGYVFLFDSGWYSILILSAKRAMGVCVCLGLGEGGLLNRQNTVKRGDLELFLVHFLISYLTATT